MRMVRCLGLGTTGAALLALSLVFDGVLEGLFDGFGVPDGMFPGWPSLPSVAGFVSTPGFSGAIVIGATGLGAGARRWSAYRPASPSAGSRTRFGRALVSDRSGAAHGVELRISTKGVDLADLLEGVTRRVCGTQPATTAFVAANGKTESGG